MGRHRHRELALMPRLGFARGAAWPQALHLGWGPPLE
jgi:hypothetical protein